MKNLKITDNKDTLRREQGEGKLEQLKKAIQKAAPEIMELGFGSIVRNKAGVEATLIGYDMHKVPIYYAYNNGRPELYKFTGEDFAKTELLGRPITLEDVLVAFEKISIQNVQKEMSPRREWEMQANLQLTLEGTAIKIIKKWKLNQPLDQQSKETIDFLHKLIVE